MSETTNPVLDELWVAEAHDRLDAYDRGEVGAISADELFEQLRAEELA